ncbi:hypothetical protein L2E82_12421 [Cichorium intybus]|uniref:Uncharacterized protein n=1 Tax=Cichorium intybus TaxID=13427 RepID=A0ACB9GGN4_CICIN|nr:hypothetical protein L2E82_12421 [Cichorium intybus]
MSFFDPFGKNSYLALFKLKSGGIVRQECSADESQRFSEINYYQTWCKEELDQISYPTLSRRLFKRGSEAGHQNHKLTILPIVADLLLEVCLWEALVIWLILFSPSEY